MKINFEKMATESRNPATMEMDLMTPLEIVTVMNDEDRKVPEVIADLLPQIAQTAAWASESLRVGGRLIYLGAGTSGRLGVLDAVECRPTFGISHEIVMGLIAGGEAAFTRSIEGAEDDFALGQKDLESLNFNKNDLLVAIAASGRTPYALGALAYARSVGARTVAICCNRGSDMARAADLAIEAEVGPEVLTGSTRLKSGTAQKLILNMISTAAMVGIGKVYQNLMVDVMQSNEKLHARAERIVMEATGVDQATARQTIDLAGGQVKTAITMILADCNCEEAEERLRKSAGHVRQALA